MNQYQLPEAVSFNYEELKTQLQEKVQMYQGLIFTEEQIPLAKKEKSNLNKLKKALNDERIRLQKEYMIPFNNFKEQIDELIRIIDEPVGLIDKQIKEVDENKKAEKLKQIKEYWQEKEKPFPIELEKVFDQKWLNASTYMKSVKTAIDSVIEQTEKDLATLQNLPEFAFESIVVYKNTLDLNKAILKGQELKKVWEEKAEQERQAAEQRRLNADQIEGQISFVDAKTFDECIPRPVKEERQWIGIKAHLSVSEAFALKAFFNEHEINFGYFEVI